MSVESRDDGLALLRKYCGINRLGRSSARKCQIDANHGFPPIFRRLSICLVGLEYRVGAGLRTPRADESSNGFEPHLDPGSGGYPEKDPVSAFCLVACVRPLTRNRLLPSSPNPSATHVQLSVHFQETSHLG